MITVLEKTQQLIDSAPSEECLFHGGKSMIISYLLPNGFTIDGRAGVVDISKFDLAIGRKVCREDAILQLKRILGYEYQNELMRGNS